jgi:hypothetical protein
MADGYDTGNMPFYNRAIRTRIGAALRAMYDSEMSQPIPHRLFTLLIDLDEPAEVEEANRLFTLLIDLNEQPEVEEAKSDPSSHRDSAQ